MYSNLGSRNGVQRTDSTYLFQKEEGIHENYQGNSQSMHNSEPQYANRKSFYISKDGEKWEAELQRKMNQSYNLKQARYSYIRKKDSINSIYHHVEYLQRFGNQELNDQFLAKYSTKYKKIIQKEKSFYPLHYNNLKKISFSLQPQMSPIQTIVHLEKYKMRDYGSFLRQQSEQILGQHSMYLYPQVSSYSQQLSLYYHPSLYLKQICEVVQEYVQLPNDQNKDLIALISKQFFLFITSSYKILKLQPPENDTPHSNKKHSQRKHKNSKIDDTQILILQFVAKKTTTNFIEEFLEYKKITDEKLKVHRNSFCSSTVRSNEINSSIDQKNNTEIGLEQLDQSNKNQGLEKKCNSSIESKLRKRKSSNFQKPSQQESSSPSFEYQIKQNKNSKITNDEKTYQTVQMKLVENEASEQDSFKVMKKDNEKEGSNHNVKGSNSKVQKIYNNDHYIDLESDHFSEHNEEDDQTDEDEAHQEDESDDADEEYGMVQNGQMRKNTKSTRSCRDQRKERTNNFYNLPRYFMILILEFLSEKNLDSLGIEEGIKQRIYRISCNLMNQGKKKDSARSNFYNHTHYNCLFRLLLTEDNLQFQQFQTNTNNLSPDQLCICHQSQETKVQQQKMKELVMKVFEVNNLQDQFNLTYVNLYKGIISHIIKYQLDIMSKLPLAQHIMNHSQSYHFEKQKVVYISRVLSGIEKLNLGQTIYRF